MLFQIADTNGFKLIIYSHNSQIWNQLVLNQSWPWSGEDPAALGAAPSAVTWGPVDGLIGGRENQPRSKQQSKPTQIWISIRVSQRLTEMQLSVFEWHEMFLLYGAWLQGKKKQEQEEAEKNTQRNKVFSHLPETPGALTLWPVERKGEIDWLRMKGRRTQWTGAFSPNHLLFGIVLLLFGIVLLLFRVVLFLFRVVLQTHVHLEVQQCSSESQCGSDNQLSSTWDKIKIFQVLPDLPKDISNIVSHSARNMRTTQTKPHKSAQML